MDADDRSSVESYRASRIAALPRWYSPMAHLAGTLSVGVASFALALYLIDGPGWQDFLIIPPMLVFANFFEWWAHKNVLHRRRRFFKELYEQHTPLHHRTYRWEDMAIRDRRELRFVLMPASGVLGIVLTATPVAAAIGLLLGTNVGCLALMAMAFYVIAYELTHLTYHLPAEHPLHRLPFVAKLAEHHARHHDPAMMAKWNFNVTVPLADFILRTCAPKELVAERRAAIEARRKNR
jgi:hypothetical protein